MILGVLEQKGVEMYSSSKPCSQYFDENKAVLSSFVWRSSSTWTDKPLF